MDCLLEVGKTFLSKKMWRVPSKFLLIEISEVILHENDGLVSWFWNHMTMVVGESGKLLEVVRKFFLLRAYFVKLISKIIPPGL